MSVPVVTDSDIRNLFDRNPSLNFSAPSFAIFSRMSFLPFRTAALTLRQVRHIVPNTPPPKRISAAVFISSIWEDIRASSPGTRGIVCQIGRTHNQRGNTTIPIIARINTGISMFFISTASYRGPTGFI